MNREHTLKLKWPMVLKASNIVNVVLRFATLIVRFIFIFVIAKYLDVASVGYYGIFTATIGYALYFVGLDYYIFATREIIKAPNKDRGKMVKSQGALAGLLYLVLTPIAFLFLSQVEWPAHLVWWFLPILVFEHINQELYRLLIVLSEQITASLILFVRQGSWAILVAVLMTWKATSRDLNVVMLLWACAGAGAATLGLWKLKRMHLGGWRDAIDWGWIRKGIAVSTTFLVATLALRGIQTVDRYWLKELAGIEVVGAYVLFFGVAGALMVFLDAGIFSFTYPELISHFQKNENRLARAKVRRMFAQTLVLSLCFGIMSIILLPYLLDWIGNPAYKNGMYLYSWVLAATVVNAVGMVPHYALYARGQDRPIISSHIAALPAFALSAWVVSHFYAAVAVPIGVCTAFGIVLIWKTLAYLNSIRNDDQQELVQL